MDADPFVEFSRCWDEAKRAVATPEAMVLATATASGRPSSRVVLLKAWDEHGFVFFTNYDSQKGQELAANPVAALLFYWEPLGRQVRIDGAVARVSRAESQAYFDTRPLASRFAATASPQSRPIADRDWLMARVTEVAKRYPDGNVPVPDHWGGYRLEPARFEFWKNGDNRLHDRFCYERTAGGGWSLVRLAP